MPLLPCLALISSLSLGASGEEAAVHRVALVVGANGAAPGRAALRYAHNDARAMASALREVGHFEAADVEVLLDPDPQQVLDKMDAKLAQLRGTGADGLFLFYYSGHADERALYPRGKPLPLNALRDRLDRAPPGVRIGIIDACRGGGWTQAKGLTPETPFEVEVPLDTSSEGSVLISSSSGLESAHESEALEESFFTHYFIAGMRGAAVQADPGTVSLVEAFAYAQQHTVRDTALKTGTPQHPSFRINLSGRSDLMLARLDDSPSALAVHETHGPLQLIQTSSGVALLELAEGDRDVRLAVPPGDYILRRLDQGRVFARELEVKAAQTVAVDESSLTLTGTEVLASKSEPQGRPRWTASLTESVVADGSAIGGGLRARFYLRSLADDPTLPLDTDALEQLQRRDLVELGAATLNVSGQELWAQTLSARIYPWHGTGVTGFIGLNEGANQALQTVFAIGASQYVGRDLRLDLGYLGERSLNDSALVTGSGVLLNQARFDGGFFGLQQLAFHGRLRLNLDLTAGAVDASLSSGSACAGEGGSISGSARWSFTRALSATLRVGGGGTFCTSAGASQTVLAPDASVGVDYFFTDSLSTGLTVSGGNTTFFNTLEVPFGLSGVFSVTERF